MPIEYNEMTIPTMDDGRFADSVRGNNVLFRADVNCPTEDMRVTDDTRIQGVAPSLKRVVEDFGAKAVFIVAHQSDAGISLRPTVAPLSDAIGQEVQFLPSIQSLGEEANGVYLFEDVRGNPGEKPRKQQNPEDFMEQQRHLMRQLKRVSRPAAFINDAYGVAHRPHTSNLIGNTFESKNRAVGGLIQQELEALAPFALAENMEDTTFVMGGAKVADKAPVMERILDRGCKLIIVGGGMANAFYKARGYGIGDSLFADDDAVALARKIDDKAKELGAEIVLSDKVVTSKSPDTTWEETIDFSDGGSVPSGSMILDVDGEPLLDRIKAGPKKVMINGPMGVFEKDRFAEGTQTVWTGINKEPGIKAVFGGGDSVAAFNHFRLDAQSGIYLSTGGGVTLELLEGKNLPALVALATQSAVQSVDEFTRSGMLAS